MDRRATHNVTNNLDNLMTSEQYKEQDRLAVERGHSLPITYSSNALMPAFYPNHCLGPSNVLFVPKITKNLLSISKFTHDNNISIEFNDRTVL